MGDWSDWLVSTGQVNSGGQSNNNAKAEAEAKAAAKAEADRKAAANAAEAKRKAAAAETAKRQAAAKKQSDDMQAKAMSDPGSMFKKANVATIDPNAAGTNIAKGTGQLTGGAPQVKEPDAFDAAKVDPTKVSNVKDVDSAVDRMGTAQGQVSQDAQATAASLDPTKLAQTELDAKVLTESQKVQAPDARQVEQGEMVTGSAVDQDRVAQALDFEAEQATPTEQATVQGQLSELMSDFEGGNTPAWAAGAMRNATAQMAARGLASSSMAGQALIQSAMEAALPIAMQDAQTNAAFETQNLSNRQQTAMFAAQQRAEFLGMEFTQEFQTRVANSAKISDIANMNFTAEQQIALENAKMAQTVDLTNLNAVNAKMMSDAAAMSQVDITNLNNRQQSAVTNAQSFLAMDLQNLSNEQQTEMFKSQSIIQGLFSDQAADNAAKQFNATSENQTNQFFANMANDVAKFNAGMDLQYDQFNAQNALVVAQANAQWRQNAATSNAAAQNAANLQHAQAANDMTQSAVDNIWQRERDIMDFSFRQSESASDRALSVLLADKEAKAYSDAQSKQAKSDKKSSYGYLAARAFGF